jgi:hypothetical protein
VKGDAHNFELAKDTYFGSNDVVGDVLKDDRKAVALPHGASPDNDAMACSSALFPMKRPGMERTSNDVSKDRASANEMRSLGEAAEVRATPAAPHGSLFFSGSTRWRP